MSHDIQVGDVIALTLPDRRWWVRLWCWVTRRPLPLRTTHHRCTAVG